MNSSLQHFLVEIDGAPYAVATVDEGGIVVPVNPERGPLGNRRRLVIRAIGEAERMTCAGVKPESVTFAGHVVVRSLANVAKIRQPWEPIGTAR